MKQTYLLRLFSLAIFLSFSFLSLAQPTLIMTSVDASCNGGTDGAASATASGGTTPYTYLWSNTATTSLINNIGAGTYFVTVTDNNGLSVVDSAIVNEPTAVLGSVTVDSNTTCFGSSDGGATVVGSGGTAPYSYNWSNAANTASVTGIMVGIYTVTITDANGCTSTNLAIINSNDNVKPVARAKDTTLYLDFNGQLSVLGTDIDDGSTDNCTIATFQVLNNSFNCNDLGANTVRLIAIDSDGNRDTASCMVTVVDSIAPSIITQSYSVTLNTNRRATFTAADIDNGTTDACGIDSLWVDTTIVFNCSNAGANSVWLYAADVNGNLDSAMATVNVVDTLSIDSMVQTANGCGSYTWAQNGQTYTSAGVYNDTLLNPFGCDSVYHVLILSIDNAQNETDTIAACDSYVWRDGNTYTSSNSTATFAIQNSNGCDSIRYTLNLTVNTSDSSTFMSALACGSYTWSENNQTYSASGDYTYVLTNGNGCDSTLTLSLEIRPLSLSVINMSDSLFAFENHPQATYQWFDCSTNSIVAGATSRGFKPDTTGFFSVIVSNGLCSDTSDCEEVISIGLKERKFEDAYLSIYPNPTAGDFTFQIEKFGSTNQLLIYDMKGQLLLDKQVTQLKTRIETDDWKAGIYFLRYNNVIRKLVINN